MKAKQYKLDIKTNTTKVKFKNLLQRIRQLRLLKLKQTQILKNIIQHKYKS